MTDREPNLVYSSHNGVFRKAGVKVEVCILKLEGGRHWTLEVVNSAGTSTVWDDLFETDDEAYAEFKRTVDEEGMEVFADRGNVIPFKR
jgi:hypothetical protein